MSYLVLGVASSAIISSIGRRGSMLACALAFSLSYLLLIAANGPFILLLGRLLTGVCTGLASVVAPVYVAGTGMTTANMELISMLTENFRSFRRPPTFVVPWDSPSSSWLRWVCSTLIAWAFWALGVG